MAVSSECDEFSFLSDRVVDLSDNRLRLVDTPDRGRCLLAAQAMPTGSRICDAPVIPHGSDLGRHLAAIVAPSSDGKGDVANRFGSGELLAGLDFLASLVKALSAEDAEGILRPLWALYRFPPDESGENPRVPMVRRWHKRWTGSLSASLPVERVEAAWRHVVPNWRRLATGCTHGSWIEDMSGSQQVSFGHQAICGLWQLMALCEHSCDPNCALSHDGSNLWFCVLRDIPEGAAVTTSYLDLAGLCLPVRLRRRETSEWGFQCACTRCLDELSSQPPSRNQQGEPAALAQVAIPERPRWASVQALLELCSQPPGDEECERTSYCQALRGLQKAAQQLHGIASPTAQSLLLRAAIFAPSVASQKEASQEHLDMCTHLHGETSAVACRARVLFEKPCDFLRQVTAEARGQSHSYSNGASQKGHLSEHHNDVMHLEDDGIDILVWSELREMYRRYLCARAWPRRRVPVHEAYYIPSGLGAGDEDVGRTG